MTIKGGTVAEWKSVAALVLAGEFDRADASTRESIRMGLKAANDPTCQEAVQRLAITSIIKPRKKKHE
jgi:hypothetical protein